MKIVKCPECKREREIENNVVVAICSICQIKMEVENGRRGKK